MGKTESTTSPLMKQFYSIKEKYPDAVVLFRVGDFYETFGTDAETVSKAVGTILTKRETNDSSISLTGFTYHSLDFYLPKLVRTGYRVAICDPL